LDAVASPSELEAMVASLSGGRRLAYGFILPLAERLIAAVFHVGTRGFVYVAYRSSNPPAIRSRVRGVFLADGIIGYRLVHQGRLTDVRVLHNTCAGFFAIAVLVLTAFVSLWSDKAS
jgi:hypothetical protein